MSKVENITKKLVGEGSLEPVKGKSGLYVHTGSRLRNNNIVRETKAKLILQRSTQNLRAEHK